MKEQRYLQKLMNNRILRDKTKKLDILYNIYLKNPTVKNKENWFKLIERSA